MSPTGILTQHIADLEVFWVSRPAAYCRPAAGPGVPESRLFAGFAADGYRARPVQGAEARQSSLTWSSLINNRDKAVAGRSRAGDG